MELSEKPIPKTPKKKSPVKRQASVAFEPWYEQQSKQSNTHPDHEKLTHLVLSLQKRVLSLEDEWQQVLEHLSEQEGSTDYINSEDETN